MNYQKLFDYLSNEHGVTLLESEMQEICNIVNEMQNQALRQPPVVGLSGQLLCYMCKKNKVEVEDDLCDDCSNDFAVAKKGEIAVKLHSIHNALHQPLVVGSVCEHPQRRREYYRDKCYKCWECLKIVVE